MSKKDLLLGNEAVARGLWEAGCRFVSSYPGTPSTEITESVAEYAEIDAEWAPNEKVALEAALGAAIAGVRSFCGMKHVGLNVAADPLFTASYTGVNAGLVIAVADDPGMHSSQNEQDSRHYARAAKLPMLEPSDSEECRAFAKLAYTLSEEYDTPVLLRLSTRVSHSRSITALEQRGEIAVRAYEKNLRKYVMMPAMARERHVLVEERTEKLRAWAESCDVNRAEYHDTSIGVICAGINYQYAKEALGSKASYYKLGCVYPLPEQALRDFCAVCKTVYVAEDLDDCIELHCRALGLNVRGKDVLPRLGEFSQGLLRKAILGETLPARALDLPLPARPPVLCPGCPHRSLFYVLKKLGVFVSGDIGCYTLGALQPLGMMDTCVCMGASVSALHGRNKALPEQAGKAVAVIGDSTFAHSGVTGLMNIAYNRSSSVVVILDNSITGMTGHQQNPTTGRTLQGDVTAAVDLEALCSAVGVQDVRVVDPYDMQATEAALRSALAKDAPAVVISRRPCVLLKEVKPKPPLRVNAACAGCKQCMRIGCPAITITEKTEPGAASIAARSKGKAQIDVTQCIGCGVCGQMCKFGAMEQPEGGRG
ncbi:MAG: indolepyruvate ferredoxin oxidoreductase subunit alpha [Oscillospiraceae bacterium]|jgi:indolepyruvate ferredoxin oxidoreductase alpha subunit|nr:indolepyruvate ferredoxin oxidoreductase subunit alpha [Oscillospiraceae bacterium]